MTRVVKKRRKRRKRKSRYKGISIPKNTPISYDTPSTMRKDFPQKLINAFVDVSVSGWADKEYKRYIKQAKAYLGKDKIKDPIESGKLVVLLSTACRDLTDKIKKERRGMCEEHPGYKAIRSPRSECKKCWSVYNVKKQKTAAKKASKKEKKAKKKKGS